MERTSISPVARRETKWKPGQSGNPSGRPKGSLNRTSALFNDRVCAQLPELIDALIKSGLAGEAWAMDIIAKRLWPIRRGAPMPISLPPVNTIDEIPHLLEAISHQVESGEISAEEGSSIALLADYRRIAMESTTVIREMMQRLVALEESMAGDRRVPGQPGTINVQRIEHAHHPAE